MPTQQTNQGFLLTRQWRDGPDGIELTFWAWSPTGPLRLVFPAQQAVCFLPRVARLDSSLLSGLAPQRKPLDLKDFRDNPVDGLYFRQQRELQRLRERLPGHGCRLLESDLKPSDRFLMERFVTGSFEVHGDSQPKTGFRELINPRLKPADVEPVFSYLSLDIETDNRRDEILSIAWCGQGRQQVLMQGKARDWPSDLPISWFADERTLLQGFLKRFAELDPDLILGWNLVNFDLDFLQRRCRRLQLPFTLGRAGEIAAVLPSRQAGQQRTASIPGRVALDGIDTLRAAFWSFDSFALEHVAQQLLGRGKLIDSPQHREDEIRRLFDKRRPALGAYNLEDCRLVEEIFQKTRLIAFAAQRAQMTGLALGRQGGSVAAFDNLYLPRLHRAGRVADDTGAWQFDTASPGGYVMESRPGLYDNVLVLDFKSLYPSIIRTFLIDPLGMACPGEDPVPGFLGATFSRRESILPDIIGELWHRRDTAKESGNKALIQAIKIIMNSFYGVLGSSGCRFYNPKLASSITRRGHQIINRSRKWIETQGYQVIYGDTDSLFVLLGPGVDEPEAQRSGRQLAHELNGYWRQTIEREFRLASFLEIEFETHYIRFLMPTIRGAETGSKKRYAGYVRNSEGANELIFKGLESVRSDWTPLARNFQRELYRRVFFDQPYADYIKDLVSELRAGQLDDQLVYRKRLRRAIDEYRRNIPPHVQAAKKLPNPGRRISYLITLNGPEPLSHRTAGIDYQHYIDRQLAPAADSILHLLGDSFEQLTGNQMKLF